MIFFNIKSILQYIKKETILRFKNYKKLQEIRRGGYGIVYRIKEEETNKMT